MARLLDDSPPPDPTGDEPPAEWLEREVARWVSFGRWPTAEVARAQLRRRYAIQPPHVRDRMVNGGKYQPQPKENPR